MTKGSNRRTFLKRSSLGALAATTLFRGGTGTGSTSAPGIQSYKVLGRTGFLVSDISIGFPPGEAVLRAGLDFGMNYIDTAEQYENGNNEKMIGKVLKDYDRKKVFVSTKIYEPVNFKSKENVVDRVRRGLERMGSDYFDCVMLHGADNTRILKDEAFHAGMARLKSEGRVRFTGVSCHGSAWYLPPEEDLETVLMAAVEDGRFDVFLMTYNFVNREKAERVLRACAEKNVGTTIMKSNPMITYTAIEGMINRLENENARVDDTLRGWHERLVNEMEQAKTLFSREGNRDEDEELLQAAIRFVINNPDAHSVCLPFKNIQQVNRWASNSGQPLRQEQALHLSRYRSRFGHMNCRFGCRECAPACPHDVKVSDIMRFNYYFQNKGQEKYAMERYAALGDNRADPCMQCEGYCEQACPYGVSVRPMLAMAHDNLMPGHPRLSNGWSTA